MATYGDGARKELWVPGDNVAKVALNLRNPGRYPGKVVLFSERDVRVLDLEFAAGNKDDRASLEFECCARETITQEIPLVNDGDRVMSVNAKFEGETAFFTGAGRDLVVSPKGRVSYPLRFKPQMPGTYSAKLTLKTGDESITYALRGVAREPMPEETIVIESVARSRTTRAFVVPNVFGSARSVIYDVTCDLDFVGGEPKCSAAAAQEGYYDLDVSPLSSGTYRGALTFTASNGYFCWFALEIRAAPPKGGGHPAAQSQGANGDDEENRALEPLGPARRVRRRARGPRAARSVRHGARGALRRTLRSGVFAAPGRERPGSGFVPVEGSG